MPNGLFTAVFARCSVGSFSGKSPMNQTKAATLRDGAQPELRFSVMLNGYLPLRRDLFCSTSPPNMLVVVSQPNTAIRLTKAI